MCYALYIFVFIYIHTLTCTFNLLSYISHRICYMHKIICATYGLQGKYVLFECARATGSLLILLVLFCHVLLTVSAVLLVRLLPL